MTLFLRLSWSAATVTDFCPLSSPGSWLDAEASVGNEEALGWWFAKCGPWTSSGSSWNLFEMQILRPTTVGVGLSNLCFNKPSGDSIHTQSGKPLLQKMAELLDGKIWACGNRNKPVLC